MKITYFNLMGLITVSHYLVLLIMALLYGILLILYFSFKKNKKLTLGVLAALLLCVLIVIATD